MVRSSTGHFEQVDRLHNVGRGRGLNPTCAAFTRPVSRVWAGSNRISREQGFDGVLGLAHGSYSPFRTA
jgi:hypothetical protein